MAANALAEFEESRGEGNVAYLLARDLTMDPKVVPQYQTSARQAFETAAANADQPDEGWSR